MFTTTKTVNEKLFSMWPRCCLLTDCTVKREVGEDGGWNEEKDHNLSSSDPECLSFSTVITTLLILLPH